MKTTKRCSKCGEEKPLEEFSRDKYQLSGLYSSCKKCHRKQNNEYVINHREHRSKQRHKFYLEHQEEKKAKRRDDYLKCSKEIAEWYESTARGMRLQKFYNITIDEYDFLLRNQNNGCAICGITPEENGRRLFVDHDHKTGKVRGLLCSKCNSAIAFFKDSRQLIMRAAQYIEKEQYDE